MSDGTRREVTLSSAAIDGRLREASQLLKLCLSLQKARVLGRVADLEAAARDESTGTESTPAPEPPAPPDSAADR